MSENQVHVVIIDKNYIPTNEQVEKAESFFESAVPFCGYDEVTVSETLRLVGSDFETITCSKCQTPHNRFDKYIEELLTSKLYNENPETEEINLPCCNENTMVSELQLGEDGAFTRFHYLANEPTGHPDYWEDKESEEDPMPYGTNMTDKALQEISNILGSPVRVFWERI